MLNSSELRTLQTIALSIVETGGKDFDLFVGTLTEENKRQLWEALPAEIGAEFQKLKPPVSANKLKCRPIGGLEIGQQVMNLMRGAPGEVVGFESGGWVRVRSDWFCDALKIEQIQVLENPVATK